MARSTLYWPTSTSKFALNRDASGQTAGGFFYAANSLSTPEHGGTHLDAPRHFSETGRTTEQIPLEQLVAPAVVIDVSPQAAEDRDYRLTRDDVLRSRSSTARSRVARSCCCGPAGAGTGRMRRPTLATIRQAMRRSCRFRPTGAKPPGCWSRNAVSPRLASTRRRSTTAARPTSRSTACRRRERSGLREPDQPRSAAAPRRARHRAADED